MFESEKRSPLDRLKKGLYSRNDSFPESPRHDISRVSRADVPVSWNEPGGEDSGETRVTPHELSQTVPKKGYRTLFLGALAFFLMALSVGAYTLFGQRNFVSVDNMDILIDGPVSIGGGETLSLNVSITNKNNSDVQLVDVIAGYPDGTKDAKDPAKDLSRARVTLGDIAAGGIVQKTFDSVMFGEEGAEREVVFTIEYRTANSNAIFYKEKSYKLKLASSPVIVSADALDKVLSGQDTPLKITVSSNSTSVVKNVLLVLDYPNGYLVSSAIPSATYAGSIWDLGDLAPGTKKTVVVNGSVQGEDGEARTVHARIGIQSQANEREIATNIVSKDHTFRIERPFLGLSIALNGQTAGDVATEAGRTVRADVIWTNNSATRISGARVEAKLSGNVLDRSSISVFGGYYDSRIDTIIWDAGRVADLKVIAPGETNRVGFTFASNRSIPGQAVLNPLMNVVVTARGDRVDESGASQVVSTGVSRSVKLVSALSISSRILRSQGPFKNTGPLPPKVDQETTYSIIWTVTNTSNSINNAKVTATLPPYVTWAGVISPEGADIEHNSADGTIVWDVGTVPQNASVGSGARQVAFQVVLRPNATQVGTSPVVVGESVIKGVDSFSGTELRNVAQGLSTVTTTDLLWQNGQGTVSE